MILECTKCHRELSTIGEEGWICGWTRESRSGRIVCDGVMRRDGLIRRLHSPNAADTAEQAQRSYARLKRRREVIATDPYRALGAKYRQAMKFQKKAVKEKEDLVIELLEYITYLEEVAETQIALHYTVRGNCINEIAVELRKMVKDA